MTDTAVRDLPRWRVHLLRFIYALIAFAEGSQVVPTLFAHAPDARGVMQSLLVAMCLLMLLGIRYPRRMLPLLLFEFGWKTIWFLAFGVQQYLSGVRPESFAEDFPAIVAGVVLMPLVLPWGYVWREYVRRPGEAWR